MYAEFPVRVDLIAVTKIGRNHELHAASVSVFDTRNLFDTKTKYAFLTHVRYKARQELGIRT
jgi:hypothetical protein